MRIATWNVNSVNPRLPRLLAWLAATSPDVVCLQELKCSSEDFPAEAFADLGYESASHGNGRWNGVAILSRVGVAEVRRGLTGEPDFEGEIQARAIAATCAGHRIWSLYVPNGRTVDHDHYQYKLRWFDALRQTAAEELSDLSAVDAGQTSSLMLLGDFNVAPTDADVWDRSVFDGATHVTEAERGKLADLESLGLQEVLPRPLKYDVAFTYWDYRQLGFPKNRGMRIDLVYATPSTAGRVQDAFVDREARKGKGTSDHAPIVIDLSEET